MKNLFKLFGVIALAAVIGFSFSACDTGGGGGGGNTGGTGGSGGGSNPFVGTWTGNFGGERVSVVITNTNWTATVPSEGTLNGTYTYSGNTATFKQGDQVVSTCTVSADGKTLTGSSFDGSRGSLTKQ